MSRGHASTNPTFFAGERFHRRKLSAHALLKMTRDLFRAMPGQKYPRNVVEMKEAMAAFFGSDSVAISCHCKRSKIILVKVLTELCSLENIASWYWRNIAVAWSDSVLLTLRRWFECGRHAEKMGNFYSLCLLHVPCNSVQKEIIK